MKNNLKKSYIVYAKRTPIGKLGGILKDVRPDDLLSNLIKSFLNYANDFKINPKEIGDIIVGCAGQAGEDNRNIARMSSVLAGMPFEVPATTINRLCGSSLDALSYADLKIKTNMCDAVLVGGVESMTRAPYVISKPSKSFGSDSKMYNSTFGWRFQNPEMSKIFPLYSMGQTAEELASKYKISRQEQDLFALSSHQKACQHDFSEEIEAVEIVNKKSKILIKTDEGPRKDTSIEKLSKLNAVFKKGGSVTAGNSSSLNDGAALLFVVSEVFLKRYNLKPVLEINTSAVAGVHPNLMGLGPIEATKKILKIENIKSSQFDIVELNEAFAIQTLACLQDLEIDQSIVNLSGGAIALGHPLGCSGARIVTTLFHQMKDKPKFKRGLATMCIGVGQGIAMSFTRC